VRTGLTQPNFEWLALLGWVVASTAWAAPPGPDLDQSYPKGSIATSSAAEQALADAAAAAKASDAQYAAESARCAHVILKTECQNNAKREHTLAQNKVHRVELEAHDLQRALAAQQRAAQRQAEQAQRQKEDAERPEKERQAHVAAQKRSDDSQQRAQDALRQQAQAPTNREHYEQRNAQHDRDEADRASAQQRNVAENERQFQEKQERAKAYAVSRAHEREQSEKARAERERKRAEQMTQGTGDAPAAVPASGPAAPAR
jgi:hypothetical protein